MSMLKNFFEIGADSTLLMDCIYHRTKNCMRNIWENIRLNLTYDEIDNSIDNLC